MVFQITVITFRMRSNNDRLVLLLSLLFMSCFFFFIRTETRKNGVHKTKENKMSKAHLNPCNVKRDFNTKCIQNARLVRTQMSHPYTNKQTHFVSKPMEYILCTLFQRFTFALFAFCSICQWNYAFTPYRCTYVFFIVLFGWSKGGYGV